MWDLIVSVPDHCLSFYFAWLAVNQNLQFMRLWAPNSEKSETGPIS